MEETTEKIEKRCTTELRKSSDTILNFTISMVESEKMQKLKEEEREKDRENSRFIELK